MTQPCFVSGTLLLLSMVFSLGSGQFQVTGPRTPVLAFVGDEAVLSCHLSPPMDAQNMEVKWYRDGLSGLVHHYRNFQDQLEQQSPEYQGRTEFLRENIAKGQVDLRIHHILPSDEGDYTCFFLSDTYYNEAQIPVMVRGLGTVPRIHVDHGKTSGIKVTCTSMGWYPEPAVKWKSLQGQHLIPASETKITEENGLFHVETSITVDEVSKGSVSCVIKYSLPNVEKEAHISLSDAFFPKSNPQTIVLIVVLIILFIYIVISAIVFFRVLKAKDNDSLVQAAREESNIYKENIGKKFEEVKLLEKEDLNKARNFAEDILLDRDTAHVYLQVSEDGKSVISVPEKQNLHDNNERFDTLVAVLGQSTFTDGNHYWEVSVEDKSRWTIGLCLSTVPRKGHIAHVNPENGFWALRLKNGIYQALSTPIQTLTVKEPILVVGIFLQCAKQSISFYNATEDTHIPFLYTFKIETMGLRPFFYPGPRSHDNIKGLTIQKVSTTSTKSPET